MVLPAWVLLSTSPSSSSSSSPSPSPVSSLRLRPDFCAASSPFRPLFAWPRRRLLLPPRGRALLLLLRRRRAGRLRGHPLHGPRRVRLRRLRRRVLGGGVEPDTAEFLHQGRLARSEKRKILKPCVALAGLFWQRSMYSFGHFRHKVTRKKSRNKHSKIPINAEALTLFVFFFIKCLRTYNYFFSQNDAIFL